MPLQNSFVRLQDVGYRGRGRPLIENRLVRSGSMAPAGLVTLVTMVALLRDHPGLVTMGGLMGGVFCFVMYVVLGLGDEGRFGNHAVLHHMFLLVSCSG